MFRNEDDFNLEEDFNVEEGILKYSDILERVEVEPDEINRIIELVKFSAADRIYLELYDKIQNPVFIDDTLATKIVKEIVKILRPTFAVEDGMHDPILQILQVFKKYNIRM